MEDEKPHPQHIQTHLAVQKFANKYKVQFSFFSEVKIEDIYKERLVKLNQSRKLLVNEDFNSKWIFWVQAFCCHRFLSSSYRFCELIVDIAEKQKCLRNFQSQMQFLSS